MHWDAHIGPGISLQDRNSIDTQHKNVQHFALDKRRKTALQGKLISLSKKNEKK